MHLPETNLKLSVEKSKVLTLSNSFTDYVEVKYSLKVTRNATQDIVEIIGVTQDAKSSFCYKLFDASFVI